MTIYLNLYRSRSFNELFNAKYETKLDIANG